MKISSQTSDLVISPELAEKNLHLFSDAGFDALDFGFCDIYTSEQIYKCERSEVFDLPAEKFDDYFLKIKEQAVLNNIEIGQTHAPFPTQITVGYTETNKYLHECIVKSIKATSLLGCKYIVIHPIFGDYNNILSPEKEHRINIDFYSSLIPYLKKYDVVACLENMWISNKTGYFEKIYSAICNDYEEANKYIDELNSIAGEERFGFCFDSGHAVLVGNDVKNALKILGKRVKALHLHDIDGIHDNHTMPFLGITDWNRLMQAIKESGYVGTLNFEALMSWRTFPENVWPQAINLLGAICKNFEKQYFK